MKINRSKTKPMTSIIITFIIIVLCMGLGYRFLPLYEDVSIQISLQFEGIENGKNPDNTRFDYNILISDDILVTLFENVGLTYTPEYAEYFKVSPILPSNIVQTIKDRRLSGEDYTYFPNEFQISVTPNTAAGLDLETAKTLMAAYPESFEDFFKDNYTFPFVDLRKLSDEIDFTKYDFPEFEVVFENKYDIISSYLDTLRRDDPEFISTDGYSFRDLEEALTLSKDLDITHISALIDSYHLSKDRELLRHKYDYMLRRYELEKSQVTDTYEINQALLTIVENNRSTMLLPGVNGETITYSQVNDTYDDIASQVTTSLVGVSNYDEEIAYIQTKIQELESPEFTAYALNNAKIEVAQLSNDLKSKLDDWIILVNTTATEYFNYKYANAIFVIGNTRINRLVSLKAFILLGFILWVVISVVLVQKNYSKYNAYNKSKNIDLN